jgi:hypothetical protein
MAGQLTIDTLKASSGVLATQNGMTGIPKAWVFFNGTTATVRGTAFNVSSITRVTAGNYTVNLTTAMPSTNFVVLASSDSSQSYFLATNKQSVNTTSAFGVQTLNGSGTANDSDYVSAALFSS